MRSSLPVPVTPSAGERSRLVSAAANVKIREQVRLAVSATQPSARTHERRLERREAYPYPVYITPVDKEGLILSEKTFIVIGKHLSDLGFDFYHRDPLPYRRVIASFELTQHRWTSLLLELTWCRFGHHGWYDNGGQFVSVVPSPIAELSMPSLLDH